PTEHSQSGCRAFPTTATPDEDRATRVFQQTRSNRRRKDSQVQSRTRQLSAARLSYVRQLHPGGGRAALRERGLWLSRRRFARCAIVLPWLGSVSASDWLGQPLKGEQAQIPARNQRCSENEQDFETSSGRPARCRPTGWTGVVPAKKRRGREQLAKLSLAG